MQRAEGVSQVPTLYTVRRPPLVRFELNKLTRMCADCRLRRRDIRLLEHPRRTHAHQPAQALHHRLARALPHNGRTYRYAASASAPVFLRTVLLTLTPRM